MSKFDAGYAQAAQIERLAAQDAVFAENYRALRFNRKYRQLVPCVTKWLIQSALARERRQAARMEQELFGRTA